MTVFLIFAGVMLAFCLWEDYEATGNRNGTDPELKGNDWPNWNGVDKP